MSEEPEKASEILASLDDYIERQKTLLEKETQILLERGRKEFGQEIAERRSLAGRIPSASSNTGEGRLSVFLLRVHHMACWLIRFWHRESGDQSHASKKQDEFSSSDRSEGSLSRNGEQKS